MPGDDSLARDAAVGLAGMVPGLGSLLEPFAERALASVQSEWKRNTSKALAAAEAVSGLTREDLAERVAADARLVPLVVRVLYAAGMTGDDDLLNVLGAALGQALDDPAGVDDAQVLLAAISGFGGHHIRVLRAMQHDPPLHVSGGPQPQRVLWTIETAAPKAGLDVNITGLCVVGLTTAGLVRQDGDAWGLAFEITDLGRTLIAALERQRKQRRS